jgi:hypothetical protein
MNDYTIRIPKGTITYQEAPIVPPKDLPEPEYFEVRLELTPEDKAEIRRKQATISAGYAVRQQSLQTNYVSHMPDGSLETVVEGRVICRSGTTTQPAPPNDLWPVRAECRPGCYVIVLANWRRAEAPRIGPREAFDPLWDELMNWLAGCPPLTDIETFWMFDSSFGNGWQLWVTGIGPKEIQPITEWMATTGAALWKDINKRTLLIEPRPRRRPFNSDLAGALAMTLGLDHPARITEDPEALPGARVMQSLGTHGLLALDSGDHWESPRIYRARDQQRENRKRRAARKRKRGWA